MFEAECVKRSNAVIRSRKEPGGKHGRGIKRRRLGLAGNSRAVVETDEPFGDAPDTAGVKGAFLLGQAAWVTGFLAVSWAILGRAAVGNVTVVG
jgi:hypothetical protein